MKGHFITIEGPDGAGKTTVAKMLVDNLNNKGIKAIYTREPGGSKCPSAEAIRKVILDFNVDPVTEAYLFAASRYEHLVKFVLPKVKEGYLVICDRFVDSSIAYQGFGHGLGAETILEINKQAMELKMPDLTLLLMIEPEDGIKRIMDNRDSREVNRFDKSSLDFHKKVYEGYKFVKKLDNRNIKVIDASQIQADIYLDSYSEVMKLVKGE